MENHPNYIMMLDHGFIGIADEELSNGDLVPSVLGNDSSIVRAARMSYGKGTKTINDDRSLLRYLVRNQHTTPLEMADIKFHVKMPIFVARQWVRHRTASINEYSGRYSIMAEDHYTPELEQIKPQSLNNKQGRDGEYTDEVRTGLQNILRNTSKDAYDIYNILDNEDLARELSRMVLPVSYYTEMYWKANLHNIFNFIRLRIDPHAQYEIRVYAEAMLSLVRKYFPIATEAFEDYTIYAKKFSRQEFELIKKALVNTEFQLTDSMAKSEKREFLQKFR